MRNLHTRKWSIKQHVVKNLRPPELTMKSGVVHESENKNFGHGRVNQAIQALKVEDCQ